MSWHEDMARRGIDSDTSLDMDDHHSTHHGTIHILKIYIYDVNHLKK